MSVSEVKHIDCLEGMRDMPSSSVSYVITSPPYNLREGMEDKGGLRLLQNKGKWNNGKLENGYDSHKDDLPYPEYVKWQQEVFKECFRLIDDAGAIFYNHKPRVVKGKLRMPIVFAGDLPLRQIIIWDRMSGFNYMSGAYMPMCEWILLIAKPNFKLKNKAVSGFGDVWSFSPELNNPHPAPFPYELPKRILESVAPIGKPILDPFSGSGTTRIAAHDFGYDFIGMEIDDGYCRMSDERFARHLQQPKLFAPKIEMKQEAFF